MKIKSTEKLVFMFEEHDLKELIKEHIKSKIKEKFGEYQDSNCYIAFVTDEFEDDEYKAEVIYEITLDKKENENENEEEE